MSPSRFPPQAGRFWILGRAAGQWRVLRGGAWNISASSLRSAYRYYIDPSVRDNDNGFRCARLP